MRGMRILPMVALFSVLVACVETPTPKPANAPGDALHDPPPAAAHVPSASPNAPTAALGTAARFPVLPMKLVVNNVARHETHVLELKADATLWGDGSVVGKLDSEHARVVTSDGAVVVAVADDGKVLAHGHATPMRFEGDDVVAEGGAKMTIDEKGQVLFLAPGKEATHMPIMVEGYVVAGKKTALLLTVLLAMPTE